ncbi:BnaC09g30380D [Brassica napus]|uniref:BnaC09g30380D protein n=1 Tax=Brassica napus TaxID=3708 RepID=A0A078G490_BRANA|nr:BnaC09g30380D [Brassica napus]
MALTKVFFSDLKTGRCSSVVEARLLRFWEAKNVKRGGELMWMDLLMVDVNSTMMQVTISAGRLPQFRDRLLAGTMFSLSGFDVSRCAQNFRLTDSSFMIRFSETTLFQLLTEPDSPLPEEAFRFRNQQELIGLANTNTQLPDIICEILSVKSTVCDPPEEKNRVMVTLKLERLVARDLIRGGVMLPAQNAVKNYSGLSLHSRVEYATIHMLLGPYGKYRVLYIRIYTSAGDLTSPLPSSYSYRVEMAISDDTAEGVFVWFDGVLTKLHSIRASEAAQMLAEDGVNPEDTRLPPFIADMEGKTYTFQVRVTAFNFTEHHKTFTITRIAEDHGCLPVDDVVNNGDDDDDDDDDASPTIEPSSAAGDQGGTSKARKKTGAGASKVAKKARAG